MIIFMSMKKTIEEAKLVPRTEAIAPLQALQTRYDSETNEYKIITARIRLIQVKGLAEGLELCEKAIKENVGKIGARTTKIELAKIMKVVEVNKRMRTIIVAVVKEFDRKGWLRRHAA